MRVLKFLGNSKTAMADIPVPKPDKGQVLVKVMVSALCGSERPDYLNPNPGDEFAGQEAGHEFAGQVVEANETCNIKVGDRVTINVVQGCGECYYCKKSVFQMCKKMRIWCGGHGEYAVVPETSCIKLPDDLDYDTGVMIGGDTLGVASRAYASLPNGIGRIALVIGSGPIGLGVTSVLKYAGYHVVVSELGEFRRKFAISAAGADAALDPKTDDVAAHLMKITCGMGPDVAVDCSGKEDAETFALDIVRPQGNVVFCGENGRGLNINPSRQLLHREVTLKGIFYYTRENFVDLQEMYKRGLRVNELVSHRFMFDRAEEAAHTFFSEKAGKVLIYRYEKEGVMK